MEKDIARVVSDLNRRFAQDLPEFYKRRIIFWNDPDGSFRDIVGEITLDNAKIVQLTGHNYFAVKKLLAMDDRYGNYVIYNPFYGKEDPEKDFLLNFKLYSEEYSADLNSSRMDEYGIPANQAVYSKIKEYGRFFASKERWAKIAPFAKEIINASKLRLAVMAAICNIKELSPAAIIRAVLSAGLEENHIYAEFVKYGADRAFWKLIERAAGYSKEQPQLSELATHLLLTAASRNILANKFTGLSGFISVPHQPFCYEFVEQWLHSDKNGSLYEICRIIEINLKLPQRFKNIGVEGIENCEIFPCIDEVILTQILTDIDNESAIPEKVKSLIVKRRTMAWYSRFECLYEAAHYVLRIKEFNYDYANGFSEATAVQLWKAYTAEYYKMDDYYRHFYLWYNKCLQSGDGSFDDLLKRVAQRVEGYYKVWFLDSLSEQWVKVSAEEYEKYGYIHGIDRQTDFYTKWIKPAESKVYVIISDAMRYGVGVSLAETLKRDTQCQVDICSCQAIFPSVTKFGMAALLPHNNLSVENKGNGSLTVLADGQSTESGNRDKILKNANPNSVAVKYSDIIELRRAERQEIVKGKDIVYIYHDRIDETAHVSEKNIFSACDEAISEIKNLIRIICNEFGGTHVVITADHGFLYTNSPLTESDKVDKSSFCGKEAEYARRYAIIQKGITPQYLQPVKFLDGKDYNGFTPYGTTRIKMSGGGMNFVHGGLSLQEVVVPVIDYHFLRNSNKTYISNRAQYDTKPVGLELLSASRKICNMIFALNFYQKEPVGDIRTAATYLLYFIDSSGVQVSDSVKFIADNASLNEQDRTYRCNFNLKPMQFNKTEKYYLVITDEGGLLPEKRIEFTIDIAFSVGDFDFFND